MASSYSLSASSSAWVLSRVVPAPVSTPAPVAGAVCSLACCCCCCCGVVVPCCCSDELFVDVGMGIMIVVVVVVEVFCETKKELET